MPDPLLEAADHVTAAGDAVYKGDCNEIFVVHTCAIPEGQIFRSGGMSVMIRRRATREEYVERCPQVPQLGRRNYYYYLGVVVDQTSTRPCQMMEGENMAYCPLTDTVLTAEEFKLYACVGMCNMEKSHAEFVKVCP